MTNGRLLHHERLLCQLPEYLSLQFRLTSLLMVRPTVLPPNYRHYLAIMAVSCYNCDYLLRVLEEQFLFYGGDPRWLAKGLSAVDPKLKEIASLNELLAHKPWVIGAQHIEVSGS